MLKISRNRLVEYNKSCRAFHQKSNKIGFAFFIFFYDFLGILQVSAKALTLFKKQLTSSPLELLIPHKYTVGSRFSSWTNGGGGLVGIRRLRRSFWPGKMWRRYRSSP
jgi:hypothetical protein